MSAHRHAPGFILAGEEEAVVAAVQLWQAVLQANNGMALGRGTGLC